MPTEQAGKTHKEKAEPRTKETATTKEFNMQELITALHRINGNKAGGPDQVHPRMLHRLGPEALKYILQMFNESWKNMRTPQNWRLADIRPIHKKDKNPEAVSSYRPISLTSVIGKWLERMVTNRLRYFMETKQLLNQAQSGFRARRSTEDQLITLSQTISDGFHSKPMQRTLITLIDYSQAFDTVWRDNLLMKMVNMQIPNHFVRWIQNWMSNRLAYVTVNGKTSKKNLMEQDVPQGSALSPLLFIVYIKTITENLEPTTNASLFANDIALYTTNPTLDIAQKSRNH